MRIPILPPILVLDSFISYLFGLGIFTPFFYASTKYEPNKTLSRLKPNDGSLYFLEDLLNQLLDSYEPGGGAHLVTAILDLLPKPKLHDLFSKVEGSVYFTYVCLHSGYSTSALNFQTQWPLGKHEPIWRETCLRNYGCICRIFSLIYI